MDLKCLWNVAGFRFNTNRLYTLNQSNGTKIYIKNVKFTYSKATFTTCLHINFISTGSLSFTYYKFRLIAHYSYISLRVYHINIEALAHQFGLTCRPFFLLNHFCSLVSHWIGLLSRVICSALKFCSSS